MTGMTPRDQRKLAATFRSEHAGNDRAGDDRQKLDTESRCRNRQQRLESAGHTTPLCRRRHPSSPVVTIDRMARLRGEIL